MKKLIKKILKEESENGFLNSTNNDFGWTEEVRTPTIAKVQPNSWEEFRRFGKKTYWAPAQKNGEGIYDRYMDDGYTFTIYFDTNNFKDAGSKFVCADSIHSVCYDGFDKRVSEEGIEEFYGIPLRDIPYYED